MDICGHPSVDIFRMMLLEHSSANLGVELMLLFLLNKHREVDCWLLCIMSNFVRHCHTAFQRDCTFLPFISP